MANVDRVEVFEGSGGFYWRRRKANGRIVAVGGEPFAGEYEAGRAGTELWPQLPVVRVDGPWSESVVGVIDMNQESGTVSAPLVPEEG